MTRILRSTSASSVSFDVPSNNYHLFLNNGGGTRVWFGTILTNAGGSVTLTEMFKGAGISSVTTAANKVTFTYSTNGAGAGYDFPLTGSAMS